MKTVSEILDKIGRSRVAELLDVRKTAVSNASSANKFPSSWYLVIKQCAAESAIEVPDELFAWRKVKADAKAVGEDAVADHA